MFRLRAGLQDATTAIATILAGDSRPAVNAWFFG
jgi:hypothetical protein